MKRLDAAVYLSLFESHPEGKKVFEELRSYFYDRQSYSRGDSYETAFNEGKRDVISFIINKMSQAKDTTNNNGEQENE